MMVSPSIGGGFAHHQLMRCLGLHGGDGGIDRLAIAGLALNGKD
jgi:hypothetical protein